MFSQFDEVNHSIAYKHYNALYCNKTYNAAIEEYIHSFMVGEGDRLRTYQYGNYLTDAALEACGHEHYHGAVEALLALAGQRGADVYAAALKHLQNFATLEHIATLESGQGWHK